MTRKNYDYPDNRLYSINGWVRLRDEGDKVTLAYKQLNDRSLHGTKEISLVVDDFAIASNFLQTIGLEIKSHQETRRESWLLGDTQIEIDTWPWIPSFAEIEGQNEQAVKKIAADLGFDWVRAKHGSVENIYQEIFEVTEEEIDGWKEIIFSPVPVWLEAKRK